MRTAPQRGTRTIAAGRRFSGGWTFFFALMLLVAVSRGAFEVVLPKSLAYGVQLAAVIGFVVSLFLFSPRMRRPVGRAPIVAWYCFGFCALVSAWLSLNINGIDFALPYVAVNLFFASVVLIFAIYRFDVSERINFGFALSTVGLLLTGVAFMQQFAGFTVLPGSDTGTFGTLSRPASITGSFLHYPLVAGLFSLALIGVGIQRARRRYVTIGIIVGIGVAASLSRSGMVILVVGLLLGVALSSTLRSRLRNGLLLITASLFALLMLPSDLFVARFLSIFDSEGAGNTTRISAWTNVIELWVNSPLIFGARAGQFTNVTSNLTQTQATVAESGTLQILVSFGLFGLVAFYGVMFSATRATPRSPSWFRAATLAGITQTAVYQSTEVFPFMVFFALLPFIADGWAKAESARSISSARGLQHLGHDG